MHPSIALYLPEIRSLCHTHQISNLWLFGSALRADFGPESDVDFLYEPQAGLLPEIEGEMYWQFQEKLQKLFQRSVDLVWYKGIKNPYLKREVDKTKVLIYDMERDGGFGDLHGVTQERSYTEVE
ncbi:MAG: hypothetical protein EAZ89_04040 [Bacteroidetes bacterium]|nr:MAG: hypothetical protein EAZ89_04040 [Bacteroidota bacterium]